MSVEESGELPGKPWGGGFSEPTDRDVEAFTESISFDRRLYREDIEGSRAHARMLRRIGLLTEEELEKILSGLDKVAAEFADGSLPLRIEWEDVHMHVEKRLVHHAGPAGLKIHTARSRNDQVALDLRLYVRREAGELSKSVEALLRRILLRAREYRNLLLPGYTHTQQAQPISGGYYFGAYAERFLRDRSRLLAVVENTNLSPLGSGALAGTTLPIDREGVARDLGFSGVTQNGLDAVGDRDFVADLLHALSLLMVHLSGWAEEWVLWSTREFGLIRLPDRLLTGSSMMPQKKNPDILELIRGKTGRVFADYGGLLALLKGLPLSYNRDLQEDKTFLFDAIDQTKACLAMMSLAVEGMRFSEERVTEVLKGTELLATDIAEDLVRFGVPFREAHAIVGRIVALAARKEIPLEGLSDADFQSFSDRFPEGYAKTLSLWGSVERRSHAGGPAPRTVSRRIEAIWKELFGSEPMPGDPLR
ncbi:MAG: argininosuccinate lyase [Nitrospiraceae bacterium]|nr:argininosuccinate lyase [Nitrospiraceae bacterium]